LFFIFLFPKCKPKERANLFPITVGKSFSEAFHKPCVDHVPIPKPIMDKEMKRS
jgi:hypothetical protein